jgi:hypothetical protein
MTPSTPPKGSLEDLFRHHLLESEAAAVRPRPQVWEQVDNSLLLAQNEKYRRRLLAYRWAMAASLLLASLAGGGWWRSQHSAAMAPSLAQATTKTPAAAQLAGLSQTAGLATTSLPTSNSSAIDQTATLSASASSTSIGLSTLASHRRAQPMASYAANSARTTRSRALGQAPLASAYQHAATGGQATGGLAAGDTSTDLALANSTSATTASPTGVANGSEQYAGSLSATDALTTTGATSQDAAFATATATPSGEAMLATRWANLAAPTAAGLPASLQEVAVAPGPPLELSRHWQYGLTYAASAYQPNIDWTRPTTVYPTSLSSNSASITRSAAAEYRDNLRAGLGQRLNLWATRRLGNGRWSLRTGLEVAQNTATSASSVAFVGEPVSDVSYTQAGFAYSAVSNNNARHLQRTSYRYRSVSVPAELRYSNPLKTGFSLYGRVGAFVSALLSVRSEVEGSPEATRSFTLQSASTPYRPYSGGLRGGIGMQYRPAGHQWSLNIGPVAEMGILSLNADPSQDFWGQQRPYSFGFEAGMELGRGFKIQ